MNSTVLVKWFLDSTRRVDPCDPAFAVIVFVAGVATGCFLAAMCIMARKALARRRVAAEADAIQASIWRAGQSRRDSNEKGKL